MLMRSPLARERRSPPGFIRPAQPVLADRPPAGPGWSFKHDGFRIVSRKDGDGLRLWSRNGRDWSAEFRAIAEALRALPFSSVILDGEAVAHCAEGLPDFHRLLGDGAASACLYAFDLIAVWIFGGCRWRLDGNAWPICWPMPGRRSGFPNTSTAMGR
jgi:bifunctional non-homologous end joining protein LigD